MASSKPRKRPGRPTKYSSEIVDEICTTIAASKQGIKRLCQQNPHWPSEDTIFTWLKVYPEFSEQYVLAKLVQIEAIVEEILEIVDDISQATILNASGKRICNHEAIACLRLRIDTRKWIACKLLPRVYKRVGWVNSHPRYLRDYKTKWFG
jgi:hypothetical protein